MLISIEPTSPWYEEFQKIIDIPDCYNDISGFSFLSQSFMSFNNLVNNFLDANTSISGKIFNKCNSIDISEKSSNKEDI